VVFQLTVEARKPPAWLSSTTQDQHVRRLRGALGRLARDVTFRWTEESRLRVVLRYEPDPAGRRERHQVVFVAVLRGCDQAGLFASSAGVSRISTHCAQGALAGALTGLGLSRTQEDRLAPALALGAVLVGAVAGAFVRREIPVYRAAQLPYAGWRLIEVEPEATTTRFRVGLA
jgi:hypothetical protein